MGVTNQNKLTSLSSSKYFSCRENSTEDMNSARRNTVLSETQTQILLANSFSVYFRVSGRWLLLLAALLLLLMPSHFSRVRLCATPRTAAHQAPPSLGFFRQEHWSGLPFPSPMHESESEVAQSCPTLSDPMDCSPPGSSVHGIFQARVLEWVAIAFSYDPPPRIMEIETKVNKRALLLLLSHFSCVRLSATP